MPGEIIAAILTSGVLAAIVTKVGDYCIAKKKHAFTVEDKQTEEEKQALELLAKRNAAVAAGVQYLLLDKILYLGGKYINEGEVDYDDRRRLKNMHEVYHSGLGGNGDADLIMKQVDELPLKV